MVTKVCSKCGIESSISSFSKGKTMKDGHKSQCKTCEKEYGKNYKKNNKEKIAKQIENSKETRTAYRIANKSKIKEYKQKYNEENKVAIAITTKAYYEANKDTSIKQYREDNKIKIAEDRKIYNKANKNSMALRSKMWRENNKQMVKDYSQRYYILNKDELVEKSRIFHRDNKELSSTSHSKWIKNNLEKCTMYGEKRRTLQRKLPASFTTTQWVNLILIFDNKCAYCGKETKLQQDHFLALSKGGEYTSNNIIPACKSCNCSKHDKNFFIWYPKQKYYSKTREKKILKFLNYKNEIQQLALTI